MSHQRKSYHQVVPPSLWLRRVFPEHRPSALEQPMRLHVRKREKTFLMLYNGKMWMHIVARWSNPTKSGRALCHNISRQCRRVFDEFLRLSVFLFKCLLRTRTPSTARSAHGQDCVANTEHLASRQRVVYVLTMEQNRCTCCARLLGRAANIRMTLNGPICSGCGEISDMLLRVANDRVFEDWMVGRRLFADPQQTST